MNESSRNAAEVAAAIVSECLAMRVRLVERAITKRYNEVTAPHGATVAQMTLLAAITRRPGVRATDLAHHLVIDASTLSRNLDRLERLGWIEIRPGEGRNRHLFVTDAGAEVLVAIHHGWSEAQRELRAQFGDDADAILRLADAARP